ncbi:MFS transporter [Clostridium beijerinckii]|uniref:MFS family arabinose efflux permease n=2 Tax=Clostridium beijerinckii TaxID=1520 RepID=A0A9Q5GPD8_CLOBE|nr:MFS transporter [Clostridium beijerinckii]AQS03318.1 putative transporter [Clostridium beijerinckii]MBA2886775.1 putative MFS family arabinose efflux permease [Clostridium beijerinckii]MBA2901509.1 putative MFS family arabinose efflux permease [Clostridium beijerinckii]MBA2911293.1 putative MFS family arabinose efflux permease [Clostridium beijerinckii]MBA9017145.1 putative MFS family arabinose efflux permease [Clostridium beijerinckii]
MNRALKNKFFSNKLLFILSIICAIMVANLYYDQVLLTNISNDFFIPASSSGKLVTAIQIGYTMGLLFIVPLGDRYSRKLLIILSIICSAILLYLMTLVSTFNLIVIVGFFMGISSVSAQLIIPFVSSNISSEKRGIIVGHLLTGVFLGVLLGRVLGGVLGQLIGWRGVHEFAAIVLLIFAVYLFYSLPNDNVKKESSYKNIILSLPPLLKKEKVLRETIVFGAAAFCAFNIFWVSLSFILEGSPYSYGSSIVGLFGFLGIAGALAAGFSGKLTNSKKVSLWNLFALAIMFVSFLILGVGWSKLIIIILVTFTLDVGSRMNMSLNQGRIYKLSLQNHSRLNSLYMVGYYLGGSLGSWISTSVYHSFGVIGITIASCSVLSLACVYYLITNGLLNRENNTKSSSAFTPKNQPTHQ